jgi:hypothetical protein
MNITPRGALAGTAVAVGVSAAIIPVIHSEPTMLCLVIGLCAWSLVAYLRSGPFADGHISLVLTAAVALHMVCFSLPAAAIWASLRDRRPRRCSVLVGLWCLCYLLFLFELFPAAAGP